MPVIEREGGVLRWFPVDFIGIVVDSLSLAVVVGTPFSLSVEKGEPISGTSTEQKGTDPSLAIKISFSSGSDRQEQVKKGCKGT